MATTALTRTGVLMTTAFASLLFGCGWADLGNDQAIGRTCDLGVASGADQATYNAAASECPSNICISPAVSPHATPPTPATGASCTGECTQDSDCEGELRDPSNPNDTRCTRGFVCATPFEKGALCCKRLCVCKDFLGPEGAAPPASCVGAGALTCGAAIPPPTDTPVAQVTRWQSAIAKPAPVDLVVMLDNSPSMAPKIAKLNAAFPRLIHSLRSPSDGTLPDLRLALIDGNLGTGRGTDTCPGLDPAMPFGDMGRFQMGTAPNTCLFTPGSRFLENRYELPLNYSGDISSVFSCLTGNLGIACNPQHQLQAFEFALVAAGVGNDEQQAAFLRPEAVLGLVFLSDEDDCSAQTNTGIFGPVLPTESASLRCATRGHACGGQNLSTSGPMYPSVSPYQHAFADCAARSDGCANPTDGSGETDTSVPTACSPLKSVRRLADELKALKANPDAQLVVAGIFGWPLGDPAQARYKIAPIPNPYPAPTYPTVLDLWPVCYDPNHLPSPATTDPATGFDATAAAWGATGGLREAAFVDEFGANGLKFSICEPDFIAPMQDIGTAISRLTQNPCFDYKLVDVDAATPGIQPDCRATLLSPVVSGGSIQYVEPASSIPMCPPGATGATVTQDCWQLDVDPDLCTASGQRISLLRPAAAVATSPLDAGVQLKLQCLTCPIATTGPGTTAGCAY